MENNMYRNLCRETDRHGNAKVYYRQGKGKRIRLLPEFGTPAFDAAYKAAEKGVDLSRKDRPQKPKPVPMVKVERGSFRGLCTRYYLSGEFKTLDSDTKRVRKRILENFCCSGAVEGRPAYGDRPYRLMLPKHVRRARDAKADAPNAANSLVKALRQVFAFALIDDEEVTSNPAALVPYLPVDAGGHHSWSVEEVKQFENRYPVGTKARLALALFLYTLQRKSDVIQFGKQHVKSGGLRFTQFKGRKRKPVHLEIPIIPELQRVIDASETGDLTFLVNEYGKPYTSGGFGNRFRKWCDDADLPHCSAHGLRKAGMAILAELGCSPSQMKAVSGHTTLKEVTHYTEAAQQKVMARSAMKRLARLAAR